MPVNTHLQTFVQRLSRIADEAEASKADRKDIMAEIKASGFDTKIVTRLVKYTRLPEDKRKALDEADELFDTYRDSI